jgi:hypothetical protein
MSMKPHAIETRWFGVSLTPHPRVEGGPRVWTILVRVGHKRVLP